MDEPKVFVSYSHDSEEHKNWVLTLANDLRRNGVDASLDQWDLQLGQDTATFMSRGISESDRVLMVCTSHYVERAEGGIGGAGYEGMIVTGTLVQTIDTKKFIPVIRDNERDAKLPSFLGPRRYIDFTDGNLYQARLDELLRELLGAPAAAKPPLGSNPFFGGTAPESPASREVGPTGHTRAGSLVLDDEWYRTHRRAAKAGLSKIGLPGSMELRFGLHDPMAKSQVELLSAVRVSEIHTFGWPIGVTLETPDEFRPRPIGDGIRAEISLVPGEAPAVTKGSYDYWALRSSGDFYLLQSLFEDDIHEGVLFFNSRIVRVAEAFMFAENLYEALGVATETRLSVRVTHEGLAGRTLASSTPDRFVYPKQAVENVSSSEVVVSTVRSPDSLTDNVRQILAPMFMLFDYAEFGADVYADIVNRFAQGRAT